MNPDIVENFRNKRVLVIGDIMLDRYVYGDATRISPEAPVPVVHVKKEEFVLGGAGNTASNISALGGTAIVAGTVGEDEEGKIVSRLLDELGAEKVLISDPSRPTTVKERVISGNNYQLLRLDYERTNELAESLEKELFDKIRSLDKVDCIIISDYAKGVISEKLARSIIKLADSKKIHVLVDTKPAHASWYKGCFLVTPNLKEAIGMTGIEQDITAMGKKLVSILSCNAFITRGPEGISVFNKAGEHTHVPSMKINKLFDVTGAGDTVIAVGALATCSGMNLTEAAELANFAAGLVVQKPGTSTVIPEELKSVFKGEISNYLQESIDVKQKIIENQTDKIEKAAHLFIDAYRHGNKVIAFGNGGSASDAQHLIGELVGRFKLERKGLPGIALTTDSSVVTAIANDYGYDRVFERQVEANASKGDVVVGISTSGNSPNVINAIQKAKGLGCRTIGLIGRDGGQLQNLCDVAIVVP